MSKEERESKSPRKKQNRMSNSRVGEICLFLNCGVSQWKRVDKDATRDRGHASNARWSDLERDR